jgi:hypothetical protein
MVKVYFFSFAAGAVVALFIVILLMFPTRRPTLPDHRRAKQPAPATRGQAQENDARVTSDTL